MMPPSVPMPPAGDLQADRARRRLRRPVVDGMGRQVERSQLENELGVAPG
jgi:hypothetical protein